MTVAEVASEAKVSQKTVRRALKGGPLGLGFVRLGDTIRISVAQYEDWLRRNTTKPF